MSNQDLRVILSESPEHPLKTMGPLAARLLIWAYQDKMPVANEPGLATTSRFEDTSTDTEMYLLEDDERQIYVFPGTSSATDWRMNIRAFPWKFNGLWVHAGFAKGVKNIQHDIHNTVSSTKEVWFIGHSLGGAYAELMAISSALDFAKEDTKANISYLTFGKPNLFHNWEKFGSLWESALKGAPVTAYENLNTTMSVVNPCDPITFIPAIRFKPAAMQTQIVLPCETETADGTKLTGFQNPPSLQLKISKLGELVNNHSMSEYESRVKKVSELIVF